MSIAAANAFAKIVPVLNCDDSSASLISLKQETSSLPRYTRQSFTERIPLHRLGLLDRTLTFFGQILFPARYLEQFLEEYRTIQPHQPSEIAARRAILAAVDQGSLRSLSMTSNTLPTLDEHHLEEKPAHFHLADAVNWLKRVGQLSRAETDRLLQMCHRPTSDGAMFHTAALSGIRVGLSTLVTVHKAGLLDKFVTGIKFYLDPGDIESMRQELLGVDRRAQRMNWSRELRGMLTSDERVKPTMPNHPEPMIEAEGLTDSAEIHPTLDALLLADQHQIPLLADDRFLQTKLLNARNGQDGQAFGAEQLLVTLAKNGKLNIAEFSDAWLQLAKWRYRFMVPKPEILIEFASRHMYPFSERLF
ncbi:MAG: hypothetical protein R3B84_13400 [Zavarzinella sp.]